MTPRVDVIGVAADEPVQAVIELVRQTGKSRFPVYQDTLDQVVGVITVIEALSVPPAQRARTTVRSVAREPVLVPDSLDLDGVLAALQAGGQDIAIVVDEYGGTDGVVSIEDLVEELVGDIADEFDVEPSVAGGGIGASRDGGVSDLGLGVLAPSEAGAAHGPATGAADVTVPSGDNSWLVDGVLREDELQEVTGFRLPEGPYETLAGFLMARLGHIPVAGEVVEVDGWEFTVVEVERRRIEQVRVLTTGTTAARRTSAGANHG
jgi:CBS domain containing-hemolysin-like protein